MSAKSMDNHNRWRSKTVAFRMSPEEATQLDMMVATSGLTKQDYIIKRVMQQEIVVVPNSRVEKNLRVHLQLLLSQLKDISNSNGFDIVAYEKAEYLLSLMEHIGNEKEQ